MQKTTKPSAQQPGAPEPRAQDPRAQQPGAPEPQALKPQANKTHGKSTKAAKPRSQEPPAQKQNASVKGKANKPKSIVKRLADVSLATKIGVPAVFAVILLAALFISSFFSIRSYYILRTENTRLQLLSKDEVRDDKLVDFFARHMMQNPRSYVQPNAPSITAKAAQLGYDADKLYDFVKFGIRYNPNETRNESAVRALKAGTANCFGNAALLVSLLRASGVKPEDVHVTVGTMVGDKLHAWVEIRSNGKWYLMDPTAMIGKSDERWIIALAEFYKGWKITPEYDFNDEIFKFRAK